MAAISSNSKLVLLCLPLISLLSTCTLLGVAAEKDGSYKVEGMFVFGSSIVDNGNNNFIYTSAKANYLPYGLDFPHGPSGRFTNGKNVIDALGNLLQLPSIPPFLDPSTKGKDILKGVNFASGGSGILDITGSIAGKVVSLNNQLNNFETLTLPELKSQLGDNGNILLSKYLFVFGVGANDYTLNYFLNKGTKDTVEDFTANLITTFSSQIKRLYNLGGRKFVIMALYPIGCSPGIKRDPSKPNECVEILNKASELYNAHLNRTVEILKTQMPGSEFVYVNQYQIIMDIVNDPVSRGFTDARHPCCEVTVVNGGNGFACTPGGNVCAERGSYVYFDGVHFTEATNVQIASKAFASSNKIEVYPINVKQLAHM